MIARPTVEAGAASPSSLRIWGRTSAEQLDALEEGMPPTSICRIWWVWPSSWCRSKMRSAISLGPPGGAEAAFAVASHGQSHPAGAGGGGPGGCGGRAEPVEQDVD